MFKIAEFQVLLTSVHFNQTHKVSLWERSQASLFIAAAMATCDATEKNPGWDHLMNKTLGCNCVLNTSSTVNKMA